MIVASSRPLTPPRDPIPTQIAVRGAVCVCEIVRVCVCDEIALEYDCADPQCSLSGSQLRHLLYPFIHSFMGSSPPHTCFCWILIVDQCGVLVLCGVLTPLVVSLPLFDDHIFVDLCTMTFLHTLGGDSFPLHDSGFFSSLGVFFLKKILCVYIYIYID